MTKKKPWFFDGSVKIDDKNEDLPILTMRIFHGDVSHNQMVNRINPMKDPMNSH